MSSEAYGEIRFPLPDSKLNQKLSIQNLTQLLEICIRHIQVGKFMIAFIVNFVFSEKQTKSYNAVSHNILRYIYVEYLCLFKTFLFQLNVYLSSP